MYYEVIIFFILCCVGGFVMWAEFTAKIEQDEAIHSEKRRMEDEQKYGWR